MAADFCRPWPSTMSSVFRLLKGLFDHGEPLPVIATSAVDSAQAERPSGEAEEKKRQATSHLLEGLKATTGNHVVGAVENFQKAFIIFRAVGDPKSAGLVQKVIAMVLAREKSVDKVRAAYKQASVLLKIAGLTDEYVGVLLSAARLEARAYRYTEAFALCRTALSHSHHVKYLRGEIEAHCLHAEFELARGKASEAIKSVEIAMKIGGASKDEAVATTLARSRAMVGLSPT